MLRIIHTADWHIGQTLAGHDRTHEHRAVLAGLARVCAEREADALIIAGDVFDTQNPSGDSQRLFYETLTALKAARPSMTIVITAGNHDAAGRLEAPRALLGPSGIHVTGNVQRKDGVVVWQPHVVALTDSRGKVAAHVLAVSYPTVACLPPLSAFDPAHGSTIAAATAALYAELDGLSRHVTKDHPLIVTGHLHVAGAIESEGAERRILVGGEHAVAPDVFPKHAAYVALGHLHKAQAVGRETVRYCGSLLPLSATELSYSHGVTLVTLDGAAATIEHIPLVRPVAFLRVPAKGDTRLDEVGGLLKALDLDASLPPEQHPFVQVCLSREGLSAGFRAALDRIADEFPVRLVDAKLAPLPATAAAEHAPVAKLGELRPEDLFERAFTRTHGRPASPEHMAAFHHALTTIER